MGAAPAIVLFDGVCNLCNGAVRFIAANDPAGHFGFLSLQSPRGAALLGTERPPEPASIVVFDGGNRYEQSDAVLHIAVNLRRPWPLAFGLILLPRGLRDAAYRWVARNRYRWFGRSEVCALPPDGLRERFLDPSASAGETVP